MTHGETASRPATLVIAGVFFMVLLDGAILNTSLPQMAHSLGQPTLALAVTVTAYVLTMAVLMPLAPWLSARCGARRLYLGTIVAFVTASAACGLAADLSQLVAARVMQGGAGGLMVVTGRIIALRRVEGRELMAVQALLVWPALLAPVIGPPLGGFITTYGSWRWNFWLNVPLGLAAVALVLRFVERDEETATAPFDTSGALWTAAALALLLGGLEASAQQIGHGPAAQGWALATMVAGGVCAAKVLRHLRQHPTPLLSLAPLGVATFRQTVVSAGAVSTLCLQATPFLLPLMFQLGYGLNALAAGSLLLAYFVGNLAMKMLTTPVLRRYGFRRVLVVDGVAAMVTIPLCGLFSPQAHMGPLLVTLVLAGASRSMLMTALQTLSLADIPPQHRAVASTMSSVTMQIVIATSITLSAWVLTASRVLADRPEPMVADFRVALALLCGLGLLAVPSYLRLPHDTGAAVSGQRA
jgi:MFS family permease